MFIRKPYNIGSPDFRSDKYLDFQETGTERIMPPRPNPGGPGPFGPPPRPGQGNKPQNNPQIHGGPQGPPPSVSPKKSSNSSSQTKFVSPGSIQPCKFQFVYIWLTNGRSFWAWLTNVDRRTASGFRWSGWRWVYFGVDLRRIEFFECFGRTRFRQEDNAVSYLNTQVLSPIDFKLEYPFIEGIPNEDVANIINEEIINVLNSLWLSKVLVPEKIDFAKIESAYEVPLDSNGILSIVFSLYTYVKGAEHGDTLFASITVDTNTGEVYNFEDLFNSEMNYMKAISDIAIDKASTMNVEFVVPYEGITDFQSFYLTPEGLVLFYQVDEYTPYNSGLFRITIPYNEISNLLYPGSPLSKLTPM